MRSSSPRPQVSTRETLLLRGDGAGHDRDLLRRHHTARLLDGDGVGVELLPGDELLVVGIRAQQPEGDQVGALASPQLVHLVVGESGEVVVEDVAAAVGDDHVG